MTAFHLVQADLAWEAAAVNRRHLETLVGDISDGTIILPEMFTTGFSMASKELAEPASGETAQWMQRIAQHQGVNICGSVITEDDGHYYNRFLWVTPAGVTSHYDKRHLFRMAGEHRHYAAGTTRVRIAAGDLRLVPQICYDLRFPAWSRVQDGSELLLYVANWPAARREQWLALLRARAIENLCYVIAVNRVGTDGNEVTYAGDSCVIDYRGDVVLQLDDKESVARVELDLAGLRAYRESFPAYLDADRYTISD